MKLKFLAQCLGCGKRIELGQEAIIFETINPDSFNFISYRHPQCQEREPIMDLSFMDKIINETLNGGYIYY